MKKSHGYKYCKNTYRPLRSPFVLRHHASTTCTLLLPALTVVFMSLILACCLYLYMSSNQSIVQLQTTKKIDDFPLDCLAWNQTFECPKTYPTTHTNLDRSLSNTQCPDYFRWIHEDLRHWEETGITRDMVNIAKSSAHFRLVILDGKAYVERFEKSFQTRDLFTLWGFQQLLRRYPGRVPDLELMFDCDDLTVVNAKQYFTPGPPPLFKYCSDPWSLDIVTPDWSFWGWPETNLKPWEIALKDIKKGNKRVKWKDRVPYAYWKGNPDVSFARYDLTKCNVNHSSHLDWNTHLFYQDWDSEIEKRYKNSAIEDQCTYRYKIYVEERTWSVSEKYILACDSPTLYLTSPFYSFFTRGLTPLEHFWPIRDNDKCRSLKFAVEWGNHHTFKAEEIGQSSSRYIQEDVKMEYVYDYMLHLLTEYAKLLKFKPVITPNAIELCSELMACLADEKLKKFMMDSLVWHPTDSIPCMMPPPYDPLVLKSIIDNRTKIIKQVEMWEDEYWNDEKLK